MNRLRSLREFVDRLQLLGEIQEIDVDIDWNLEMGAVIRRSYELQAAAPLFNRITTAEIGRRSGFSDASHFTKVLRRHTGQTPRQMRRGRPV